jgi:hypothetical protein
MKKIVLATALGVILLLSGMEVAALETDVTKSNNNDKGNRDFTHTVFAEDGTATWCGFCHYAREALDAIYTSGDYPFYYVCLVDDKNIHAAERNNEYNFFAEPTVWFDYGYNVTVGGYTYSEDMYRKNITDCGARSVADIDVDLNVVWLGNATMNISVAVKNNEAAPYVGHLHVYVTEVESSMGWKDTLGHPYTFPFLDYAFDRTFTMGSGETWENSIIWDGHDYTNGSVNFGSIQYGNIAVIAAVFNNTAHLRYSIPQYEMNPFDAYFVDDTAGFLVGGTWPYVPSQPHPADGATNVDVNAGLSWTGGGSPGGTITYDVYFGTTNPPSKVASNQSATTYTPGPMEYNTSFYWKIVAWDQDSNTAQGPVWHFITLKNPNNKPNLPTITGPAKGEPGKIYRFTVTGTDPDEDMIYTYVDWGDGTPIDSQGPYDSGEAFSVSHVWSSKGTFIVKIKAMDEHGAESDWVTLSVIMPAFFNSNYPSFLHWLFEQFPHAFPVFRSLLGV